MGQYKRTASMLMDKILVYRVKARYTLANYFLLSLLLRMNNLLATIGFFNDV